MPTTPTCSLQVDTGVTSNVLTPAACEALSVVPEDADIRALAADGDLRVQRAVLHDVTLEQRVPVPQFTALVFDFPQCALAARQNVPLHGVVGMQFLEQFDLHIRPGEVEVYAAGGGLSRAVQDPSWQLIRGIVMATGLMAVQVQVDGHAQPFLGIVDTGASGSMMNRVAAETLGDAFWERFDGKGVAATGMAGKTSVMPAIPARVSLSSFHENLTLRVHQKNRWWALPMEDDCAERVAFGQEVPVAIGEWNYGPDTGLPELDLHSYKGPLMLIGQDILTQRELIFNGKGKQMLFGKCAERRGC